MAKKLIKQIHDLFPFLSRDSGDISVSNDSGHSELVLLHVEKCHCRLQLLILFLCCRQPVFRSVDAKRVEAGAFLLVLRCQPCSLC